jgi:TIGR03009 family protein
MTLARLALVLMCCLLTAVSLAQQPGQPPYQPASTQISQGGTPQGQMPPGQGHPAGPQQVPRPPVMKHAPFPPLTPQQDQELKAALSAWEHSSAKIDLLRCNMTVKYTDMTFKSERILHGYLKYQSPDKGAFYAADAQKQQVEQWICDGKSVYAFEYSKKQVVRRDLPPELQGAGIGDGPLPFFFGAKAHKLLHRYFMRLVTPENPENIGATQIWIEAYPRFQHDAANYRRATVILDRESLLPQAVELYTPGNKERAVYTFSQTQVGRKLLERLIGSSDFQVSVPSGWQMVVNPGAESGEGPAAHSSRVPPPTGPIRKLLQR